MSGYSPAPWTSDGMEIIAQNGNTVAHVDRGTPNRLGNLRIMKAAPEMRAVLIEVRDFWAGGDCPPELWTRLLNVIEAAS